MINIKEYAIIKAIKKGYCMIFKTRVSQIVSSSIICFAMGIGLTSAGVFSIDKFNERRGVGGFETSVVPQFNDELIPLLQDNVSQSEISLSDIGAVEESEESLLSSNETTVLTYLTYRVQKGDMIGYIADEFDVTQDTIISINNIRQSRLIQPGQYLKIPSMPGILYTVKTNGETPATIAAKYEIDAEKCALVNSITTSTELNAGSSIFVPDAELDWTTRQEINGDLFHKPLKARYWLSSPYGWRDSPFNTGKRTFHGGMDMAVGSGTPIYAALDGKVTAAGYNATYGNYVIISHHSGYKTLYGHMSSINCKVGNFVYTNTVIGRVGSTGLSTGPHLHFTVYKNGKTVNPALLIN